MRILTLSAAVLGIGLMLSSCTNHEKKEDIKKEEVIQKISSTGDSSKITTNTIINADGSKLTATFDNRKDSATFVLNGEKIKMVQDTMASGVKFHNDHYEYTNWHGETEIKKDGKTVFKDKK